MDTPASRAEMQCRLSREAREAALKFATAYIQLKSCRAFGHCSHASTKYFTHSILCNYI